MNSRSPQMLIRKIRAARPELLDWGSVVVRTLKDPRRPLSIVSDLGVIHAGMEKESAVRRICDSADSYVIKQHFDPSAYARETANIAFINSLRPIAPEILYSDDEAGVILMEDLGDRSLAHLAINNRMAEYERWVRRAFSLVALIQSHFRQHEQNLRRLYGGRSPESGPYLPLPDGLPCAIAEILRISRGTELTLDDRQLLEDLDAKLREGLEQYGRDHSSFTVDLTPWHIIDKDGEIRFLDFTRPPVSSLLLQFNVIWRLENRRDIVRFYLAERAGLGLPHVNTEEFLRLQDRVQFLECIEWIRHYCRDILEERHFLASWDGSELNDYEGSEKPDLDAALEAVSPYKDFDAVAGLLRRYFRKPITRP
jgi:hypothetical protein